MDTLFLHHKKSLSLNLIKLFYIKICYQIEPGRRYKLSTCVHCLIVKIFAMFHSIIEIKPRWLCNTVDLPEFVRKNIKHKVEELNDKQVKILLLTLLFDV